MIRAVLLDRDGTLIVDRASPVELMPGAASAVARFRAHGMRIGVVTNQPHAGSDPSAQSAMHEIHRQIEARVGPLDGWFVCMHRPDEGCACRKPQPGLIHQAARAFDLAPNECIVVGDIGSDVEAARRAGAAAILVPTPVTLREEIDRAPAVCKTLNEAADLVLERAAA